MIKGTQNDENHKKSVWDVHLLQCLYQIHILSTQSNHYTNGSAVVRSTPLSVCVCVCVCLRAWGKRERVWKGGVSLCQCSVCLSQHGSENATMSLKQKLKPVSTILALTFIYLLFTHSLFSYLRCFVFLFHSVWFSPPTPGWGKK